MKPRSSRGRRTPGDRPADSAEPAAWRLRVETEAMPDGREIHYYSWPHEDPNDPSEGRPPPPAGPADE